MTTPCLVPCEGPPRGTGTDLRSIGGDVAIGSLQEEDGGYARRREEVKHKTDTGQDMRLGLLVNGAGTLATVLSYTSIACSVGLIRHCTLSRGAWSARLDC